MALEFGFENISVLRHRQRGSATDDCDRKLTFLLNSHLIIVLVMLISDARPRAHSHLRPPQWWRCDKWGNNSSLRSHDRHQNWPPDIQVKYALV